MNGQGWQISETNPRDWLYFEDDDEYVHLDHVVNVYSSPLETGDVEVFFVIDHPVYFTFDGDAQLSSLISFILTKEQKMRLDEILRARVGGVV